MATRPVVSTGSRYCSGGENFVRDWNSFFCLMVFVCVLRRRLGNGDNGDGDGGADAAAVRREWPFCECPKAANTAATTSNELFHWFPSV